MALVIKRISGKNYYYSFLIYRVLNKPKGFSKYIGIAKPTKQKLALLEDSFKEELIKKLSGKEYSAGSLDKDEIIKTLLFAKHFNQKYQKLTELKRRKYDVDSTVSFILTTLTTEEVDVDLNDVKNALVKTSKLTERERISRNMLNAVESIKHRHKLDKKYLLSLHKTIMASFKTKTPGKLRDRQVYLYRKGEHEPIQNTELKYRPPGYSEINNMIDDFLDWYDRSGLNPIEKASTAHYKLYKIHPFLDGNKRICRLVFNKTLIDNDFPLINLSVEKELYFDALASAVETDRPQLFVDFSLGQYYKQVKMFLKENL
ncbi:MAG: Fic family protein [Candidatus Micrarchaeota archaeon]|nr:Fic family protein [Candidatus Micrarchaeota archaeon]